MTFKSALKKNAYKEKKRIIFYYQAVNGIKNEYFI